MPWNALSSGEKLTAAKYNERLATRALIDGNDVPAVLVNSYNCDSVTDNGVGDYTVIITTDFLSALFQPVATAGVGTQGIIAMQLVTGGSAFDINIRRSDTQALFDANRIACIAVGDQT